MDEGRQQAYDTSCKAQSSALAPAKQCSFTGGHPQTDKETVASLSLLWLSLLIITPTVLTSVGEILFLAGAATLLSQKDFIYPLFVFTELPCEWGGGQGQPDKDETSTLPRSAAWCERHIRFGCVWYSWCWTAAQPHCFNRNSSLAQASTVPALTDVQRYCSAAAEPSYESLFVSVEEWPNPIMQ